MFPVGGYPRDWEGYTDGRGERCVLPPALKVCECSFCGAVCTRANLIESVGKLKVLYTQDYLRVLAGWIAGRPYCHVCHPGNPVQPTPFERLMEEVGASHE